MLALEALGFAGDKATAVAYTLGNQKGRAFRFALAGRAPTALNVRGIKRFGGDKHADAAEARGTAAREWPTKTAPRDTEDRVFRLVGLRAAGAPVQRYFDAGLPYERDQFVSTAASGWAATALALALPKK